MRNISSDGKSLITTLADGNKEFKSGNITYILDSKGNPKIVTQDINPISLNMSPDKNNIERLEEQEMLRKYFDKNLKLHSN